MDHGVVMFPTEYSIAPDELARALEERGFESVWFPEHTHIPASHKGAWPGGLTCREYWSAYDPFVALMAAAGATRRLKDLPGDRARPDRHRQGDRHARPPVGRARALRHRRWLERGGDGEPRHRVEEPVAAAAGAGARHEGDLDPEGGELPGGIRAVRPDLVRAEAAAEAAPADHHRRRREKTFDRVVEFGDGWMPILRPHTNPVDRIPALHERLQKGRDPKSAPVSIFFAPPKRGGARQARGGRGVARDLRSLPEPRDKILPRLDALAALIRS
jgi:hypothetical protein